MFWVGRRRSPTRTCAACRAAPRRVAQPLVTPARRASATPSSQVRACPPSSARPATSMLSFSATGTPASGPSGSPRRAASSIRCACSSARSAATLRYTFSSPFGPLDPLQVRLRSSADRRQLAGDDPLVGPRAIERSAAGTASVHAEGLVAGPDAGLLDGISLPSSRENTSFERLAAAVRELRISPAASRSPPRRSPGALVDEDHAVGVAGQLDRGEVVEHVLAHQRRVALERIAVAATVGLAELDVLAGLELDAGDLRLEVLLAAACPGSCGGGGEPVPAAEDPARRVVLAVALAGVGAVDEEAVAPDDPDAAAPLARAPPARAAARTGRSAPGTAGRAPRSGCCACWPSGCRRSPSRPCRSGRRTRPR